ncbi:penicillin-binding protein 1C, partial [Klebsiella pneumoniae]
RPRPAGAGPNLALLRGGAGGGLEVMVGAYSAFARHGKAARLRLKPSDPLTERALMSPGAAWIVRRILAGEAQPVPDASLPQAVPLAWKTGTSYGYRDAWAVGLNARYLIGIWTGRPDGTPVVGQFGFASAVPLLNQVNNLLLARPAMSRGGLPSDPRPATVSQGTICWPGGQDLPAGDSNCRRRLASWLLDASQPPTLLLPGQESVRGIRFPVWRNEHGERVAADCPGARESQVEVWPLPLEPWLPASERRRARLGPASESCPPLQTQDTAPLVLSGIRDGAVIKRLPGEARVMLPLQTSGGEGRRWWFINGEPLEAAGARTTLTLDKPGEWQLVVMDEAGQTAAASFTLQ